MKRFRASTILFAISCIFTTVFAYGQSAKFADPNVDYSFEVPDAKWKMAVKPSATSPNVEFVYVDRNDGHLEVRKLNASRATIMADIIREQEEKLQFMPGYVAGKQENFNGKLSGNVFNFEFVRAGRPMSGRFYFLRSGDSVYLLRFTGFQDSLRSIRHHTDSIARTFDLKRG